MEIPNDWWVAQDTDDQWIHQQMLDYQQELYEQDVERQRAMRQWVQLELDLGDDNELPANPF